MWYLTSTDCHSYGWTWQICTKTNILHLPLQFIWQAPLVHGSYSTGQIMQGQVHGNLPVAIFLCGNLPVANAFRGSWHFVEVPGVVAARRVVLRGTWLVKVSPSCCILHCPGPGVACSLFWSALSKGSPPSFAHKPFTYWYPLPTKVSLYLQQAFRNLPHTNFVRRNCPQSAASLRTRRRKD